MKKLLALVLVLVFTLSAAGIIAYAAEDEKVFRIGAFVQLTGSTSVGGNEAKNSIEVAAKYINENGGFNGAKVVVDFNDTQGSPEEAIKIANQYIFAENYDAIIGSVNSNECLAAFQYVNDAEILAFGLGTAASWMAQDWEYIHRATMNNSLAAPLSLSLVTDMNYGKVAVFCGQDEASINTANTFLELCKEANVEVVAFEKYDDGDVDYSAQIAKLIASNPDVIYTSLIGNDTGSAIKQIREGGWDGMIILKESYQTFSYEVSGPENSKYLAFANPYVCYSSVESCPDSLAEMKAYLPRYVELIGSLPTTDSGYRGWDAMMCLWEASKIAGANDTASMMAAIPSVSIEGLGGKLDFSDGTREGYGSHFNRFCFMAEEGSVLWQDWLDGYAEAFHADTGK